MRKLTIGLLIILSVNSSIYAASRPRSARRQSLCSWKNLRAAVVGLILVSSGKVSAQNNTGALMAYPKIGESPAAEQLCDHVKLTGYAGCTKDRPYIWLPCNELESPDRFAQSLFVRAGPKIDVKMVRGSCSKPCMTYDQVLADTTLKCRRTYTTAEIRASLAFQTYFEWEAEQAKKSNNK